MNRPDLDKSGIIAMDSVKQDTSIIRDAISGYGLSCRACTDRLSVCCDYIDQLEARVTELSEQRDALRRKINALPSKLMEHFNG